MEQLQTRLNEFISRWQGMIDKHYQDQYNDPNLPRKAKVSAEEGRRYWKILVTDSQTSARAFIDRKTGDIFMAATYKAPAKHARGSILAPDFGMSCMNWYGPKYLR